MLLTPAQLQEIRAIIQDYHNAFVVNCISPAAVAPEILAKLRKMGMVDIRIESVQDAYIYGQLLAHLDNPAVAKMSYLEFREFIKKNPIPMSPVERQAVKMAEHSAGQYCVGLGNRVDVATGAVLIEADAALRNSMHDTIRTQTAEAIARRESVQKLASNLGHATGDWSRDWRRIANTEMQTAMQTGLADRYRVEHGADVRVAKVPMPDACEHCKRLFLGPDGKPYIWKLSELQAFGTNVGRKTRDWVPTVGTVHPHCQCQLIRIPRNFGFDAIGRLVPGGKLGVEADAEDFMRSLQLEDEFHKAMAQEDMVNFQGLPIKIENRAGELRHWESSTGERGTTHMLCAYGEVVGSDGADGDGIDVYVGPDPKANTVYVVHQQNPETGVYDEDKAMLGFPSEEFALQVYRAHFNKRGFDVAVSPMGLEQFKTWADESRPKHDEMMSKPVFILPLEKAQGGPFIGPRGGLWADPQHTIHWDPKIHGPAQLGLFTPPPPKARVAQAQPQPQSVPVAAPKKEEESKKEPAKQEPVKERMPAEQRREGKAPQPKVETIHHPNFLKWFGDWRKGEGSKVVNTKGEPQEQYGSKPIKLFHGTAVGGFRSFSKEKDKGSNIYGHGFYFTEDRGIAEEYTKKDADEALAATTHFVNAKGDKIAKFKRNQVEDILRRFGFVTPKDAKGKWSAKETDYTEKVIGSPDPHNWKMVGLRTDYGRQVLEAIVRASDDEGNVDSDKFLDAFWHPQTVMPASISKVKFMIDAVVDALKEDENDEVKAVQTPSQVFEVYLNVRKPLDMDAEVPKEELESLADYWVDRNLRDQYGANWRETWKETNLKYIKNRIGDTYKVIRKVKKELAESKADPNTLKYHPATITEQEKGLAKLESELVTEKAFRKKLEGMDEAAFRKYKSGQHLKQLLIGYETFEHKNDFEVLAPYFGKDYDPKTQMVPLTHEALLAVKKHLVKKHKGDIYDGRQIMPLLYETPSNILTWGDVQYLLTDGQSYRERGDDINAWAKSKGYDGIHHTGGWNIGKKKHSVWIAWEPTQIKASNSENFDASTDDIYKGDFIFTLPLQKAEGGPFIGPRGGKWANPEMTVPWKEKAGKRSAQEKIEPISQSKSYQDLSAGYEGPVEPHMDLKATEHALWNVKRTEHSAVFDANGKQLFRATSGNAHFVKYNKEQVTALREAGDAILTHNHPSGIGLSVDDVWFMMSAGLQEIRAVGSNGTIYSLERPKAGWEESKIPDIIEGLKEASRKAGYAASRRMDSIILSAGGIPGSPDAKGFSQEAWDGFVREEHERLWTEELSKHGLQYRIRTVVAEHGANPERGVRIGQVLGRNPPVRKEHYQTPEQLRLLDAAEQRYRAFKQQHLHKADNEGTVAAIVGAENSMAGDRNPGRGTGPNFLFNVPIRGPAKVDTTVFDEMIADEERDEDMEDARKRRRRDRRIYNVTKPVPDHVFTLRPPLEWRAYEHIRDGKHEERKQQAKQFELDNTGLLNEDHVFIRKTQGKSKKEPEKP